MGTTYAGFTGGESQILEDLYDQGVNNGQCIDPDNEFYKKDRLLVIWNTKPTTPWQTTEYYTQEAAMLLEVEFNRVHRNQWGSSTSSFVPMEWFDACAGILPPYEKLEPWVISLDAAISGDCFAMIGVTRINEKTIVRFVKKWTPPQGGENTL